MCGLGGPGQGAVPQGLGGELAQPGSEEFGLAAAGVGEFPGGRVSLGMTGQVQVAGRGHAGPFRLWRCRWGLVLGCDPPWRRMVLGRTRIVLRGDFEVFSGSKVDITGDVRGLRRRAGAGQLGRQG
ncbi:hypothetical protein GCM10009603_45650 [Nocardiopsis exhalans]